MARQLVLAVTFKATPLIVDNTINSLSNADKNVYQVFRFAGRFCMFIQHDNFLSLKLYGDEKIYKLIKMHSHFLQICFEISL